MGALLPANLRTAAPDLESAGCVLIPKGRKVLVYTAVAVPWIAAEVDGRVVVGATIPAMVGQ
jgi:hypothetical protein